MANPLSAQDLRNSISAVYGDTVDGKSFTDAEAALLCEQERRVRPNTASGWHKVWRNMVCWTVINCRPETPDEVALHREALASQ